MSQTTYHTRNCNSHRGPQYPCDCSVPNITPASQSDASELVKRVDNDGTQEWEFYNVKALLQALDAIAVHDWRTSFLAHTSDTAYEARNTIIGLLAARTKIAATIQRLTADAARREGSLAAGREKFTMHTAQVHAWFSGLLQELGIAKEGDTLDVATACSKAMDKVALINAALRDAQNLIATLTAGQEFTGKLDATTQAIKRSIAAALTPAQAKAQEALKI